MTQIPIVVNFHTLAVLDMGWSEFGVAVEYDGDLHRADRMQYVKDQRRLRNLVELGSIVIRVIAEDKAVEVVERVVAALLGRGWRPNPARVRGIAG
jgi:very-short-patch-repair endonuclease